jgi:hypothetical protein
MVFKHRYRSQRYPFCVFIDFEATSIRRSVTITYKDNDELIFEDVQLPNSIGIFCPELNEKPCFIYDADPRRLGKKIAIKLKEIRNKAVKIMLHNRETKNIIMTEEEKARHETLIHCEDCGVQFANEKGKYKCRDHDHATGRYRATLCSRCNFKKKLYVLKFKLNVYAHNLKGYDGHFILKYVCPYIQGSKHNNDFILSKSAEKFAGFDHGYFSFRDTMSHLDGSLGDIAKALTKFPYCDKYGFDRKGKGFYPYEWFDSFDKFDYPELPHIIYRPFSGHLSPT